MADKPKISDNEGLLLLARIDALQALLAVYRTNGRPTEKLFARLERTGRSEALIRAKLDVAGEVAGMTETTARPSEAQLLAAITEALKAHDMPAVAGLLRLLAIEAPDTAETIVGFVDLLAKANA